MSTHDLLMDAIGSRAPAAMLDAWRALGAEQTVAPGGWIVRQLHPATSLFVLVDGEVRTARAGRQS